MREKVTLSLLEKGQFQRYRGTLLEKKLQNNNLLEVLENWTKTK